MSFERISPILPEMVESVHSPLIEQQQAEEERNNNKENSECELGAQRPIVSREHEEVRDKVVYEGVEVTGREERGEDILHNEE